MLARLRKNLYLKHRVLWVITDNRDRPIMSLYRRPALTILKPLKKSTSITRERLDLSEAGYLMRSEQTKRPAILRSALKIKILLPAKISLRHHLISVISVHLQLQSQLLLRTP